MLSVKKGKNRYNLQRLWFDATSNRGGIITVYVYSSLDDATEHRKMTQVLGEYSLLTQPGKNL